ncbi:MAG TPA: hypothetical protein VLV28_03745 [Gaiellaceae bacterium]|nr:hypothetical protein [Gaiellaceae bacterium]
MSAAASVAAEPAPSWVGLDDFDPAVRKHALDRVCARAAWPSLSHDVNLHCHTFFSYNAYGYSPTHLAVLARAHGLEVAGTVDFDGLESAGEFLAAAGALGLKAVVSLESRVFVPELADVVVNSPGEPGIVYSMGVGFPGPVDHPFLAMMRSEAEGRLRDMLERVNPFMRPVELDFERDVLSLTPGGNATERHLCEAFERRARRVFPANAERASFWQAKLGAAPPEGSALQSLIRARLLKRGGVGYVQPDGGSFPLIADLNRVVAECGAIPTLAWLDGTSEGEGDVERLFSVAVTYGIAALNIVPDRNYTPGVRDRRLENLEAVVAAAGRYGFPIVVGTEMNAPGNRIVDDFASAELRPLAPVFERGALIVYGHSALERQSGLGYLGSWAHEAFPSVFARNDFYAEVGRRVGPAIEDRLQFVSPEMPPEAILARLG